MFFIFYMFEVNLLFILRYNGVQLISILLEILIN